MLFSCACAKTPVGGAEPSVSPAPRVPYSATHYIRYWPEDADYESCDYSCVVELPEFDGTYTAAFAMNRAVQGYLEDLQSRIENQYLVKATAEKPHTEVTLSVEYIPGCTDIVFTEAHSYSDTPYEYTYALMLDDYGNQLSLADIFLDYHAESRVSKLVAKQLGCDEMSALAAVDIIHGAKATLAGCSVFVRAGVISALEYGEKKLDFSFSDLSPASELDALDQKQFESVTELLCFAANAAAVRQENITGGILSEFEASSFMGEFIRTRGIMPKAGRIEIKKDEFEAYYRSIFGADFPGIDTNGHDIKLENGVYSIRDSAKQYEYHVDIFDAYEQAEGLIITGDMIFGAFGYAFSSYTCHVRVVLERASSSPYGFRLVEFVMS